MLALKRLPLALRIVIERTPGLELVRITEAAAIAASHWMGHGEKNQADQAADRATRKRPAIAFPEWIDQQIGWNHLDANGEGKRVTEWS